MKKTILLLSIFALMLGGCASATNITQPLETAKVAEVKTFGDIEINKNDTKAPEHFILAVQSYIKQSLQERSLYDEESGKRINVSVNKYRMRKGMTRMMFGIFAGKDGIDSTVKVYSPDGNKVLGSSEVSSYNVMAVGSQDDIARMHGEEIVKFLTGEEKEKSSE